MLWWQSAIDVAWAGTPVPYAVAANVVRENLATENLATAGRRGPVFGQLADNKWLAAIVVRIFRLHRAFFSKISEIFRLRNPL